MPALQVSGARGDAGSRALLYVGGAADGRTREALRRLESDGWRVHRAADLDQARRAVLTGPALRVALLRLERYDARSERCVHALVEAAPDTAWVALVRRDCLDLAPCRALIRRAFYDFHTLPADPNRLVATVGHAHGMASLHNPDGTALRGLLVGDSRAIHRLRVWVAATAEEPLPALVVGPSGSGKSRVAHALHLLSSRRQRPFVAVDARRLAALRDGGLGALERRLGEAGRGTLLVRHVERLPAAAQRLLVHHLRGAGDGGARIVCTARAPLRPRARAQAFSAELCMMLQGRMALVPPLRERPEDLRPLAYHFLSLAAPLGLGGPRGFTRRATEAMAAHDWPGNVRELETRVRAGARLAPATSPRPPPCWASRARASTASWRATASTSRGCAKACRARRAAGGCRAGPPLRIQGRSVVMEDNTRRARLLLRQRVVLDEGAFAELVVWELGRPVRGSAHRFKCRLAYVERGRCRMRFGNEAGKGDHCHLGDREMPYRFESLDRLLEDFWRLIDQLRGGV